MLHIFLKDHLLLGRWSLFVMYKIYGIQISNLYQHKHIDNLHKTTDAILTEFYCFRKILKKVLLPLPGQPITSTRFIYFSMQTAQPTVIDCAVFDFIRKCYKN